MPLHFASEGRTKSISNKYASIVYQGLKYSSWHVFANY